jgi:hypothetical protein
MSVSSADLYTASKSHDPGHKATGAFLTMRFLLCAFSHTQGTITERKTRVQFHSPVKHFRRNLFPFSLSKRSLWVQKMIWNNK